MADPSPAHTHAPSQPPSRSVPSAVVADLQDAGKRGRASRPGRRSGLEGEPGVRTPHTACGAWVRARSARGPRRGRPPEGSDSSSFPASLPRPGWCQESTPQVIARSTGTADRFMKILRHLAGARKGREGVQPRGALSSPSRASGPGRLWSVPGPDSPQARAQVCPRQCQAYESLHPSKPPPSYAPRPASF